uniref:Uncharacterized protein LOC110202046 isoform X1 n=1 Tax=Phascolarctos cinereus TaxID=38626 RepID=A0A6P5JQY0_PHACI|nr:uncharacterized protein LOC110202046 isoform X1 [Phascolarctos cinereus]
MGEEQLSEITSLVGGAQVEYSLGWSLGPGRSLGQIIPAAKAFLGRKGKQGGPGCDWRKGLILWSLGAGQCGAPRRVRWLEAGSLASETAVPSSFAAKISLPSSLELRSLYLLEASTVGAGRRPASCLGREGKDISPFGVLLPPQLSLQRTKALPKQGTQSLREWPLGATDPHFSQENHLYLDHMG